MKVRCTGHDKEWCQGCECQDPHEPRRSVFVNRQICTGIDWECLGSDGISHTVRCVTVEDVSDRKS